MNIIMNIITTEEFFYQKEPQKLANLLISSLIQDGNGIKTIVKKLSFLKTNLDYFKNKSEIYFNFIKELEKIVSPPFLFELTQELIKKHPFDIQKKVLTLFFDNYTSKTLLYIAKDYHLTPMVESYFKYKIVNKDFETMINDFFNKKPITIEHCFSIKSIFNILNKYNQPTDWVEEHFNDALFIIIDKKKTQATNQYGYSEEYFNLINHVLHDFLTIIEKHKGTAFLLQKVKQTGMNNILFEDNNFIPAQPFYESQYNNLLESLVKQVNYDFVLPEKISKDNLGFSDFYSLNHNHHIINNRSYFSHKVNKSTLSQLKEFLTELSKENLLTNINNTTVLVQTDSLTTPNKIKEYYQKSILLKQFNCELVFSHIKENYFLEKNVKITVEDTIEKIVDIINKKIPNKIVLPKELSGQKAFLERLKVIKKEIEQAQWEQNEKNKQLFKRKLFLLNEEF
jgi:hypothetical protein